MTGRKPAEQAQETSDEQPLTGVFVAKQQLFVEGVLAFNPGDIVPAGHVQRFKWRDQVRDFDDESGD